MIEKYLKRNKLTEFVRLLSPGIIKPGIFLCYCGVFLCVMKVYLSVLLRCVSLYY